VNQDGEPALDGRSFAGRLCRHCGAKLGGASDFCCSGCEAAFNGLQTLAEFDSLLESDSSESGSTSTRSSSLNAEALEVDYDISGIHCAGCVNLLERIPKSVEGILAVRVNLSQGTIVIDYLPDKISLQEVEREITKLGYQLSKRTERDPTDNGPLYRIGIAAFCAMNTMMLAVSLFQGLFTGIESEYGELFRWLSLIVTLPAISYCSYPFYRNSIAGLKSRTIHIDLPLSLAIVAAFSLSVWNTIRSNENVYFDSICALVFLLLIGRFIQSRALARARKETEISWSVLPSSARLLNKNGVETMVESATLNSGDIVVVYPLERFPVDGEVLIGESTVESALITGESRPEIVGPGSKVIAGALNLEGEVQVLVACSGADTRVGRLLREIERATRPSWGLSAFVDRASAWFTGVVIFLAIAGGLFWLAEGIDRALEIAVTFLIVTCPCALGIATPLAVGIMVGRASKRGVFIKSADAIEKLTQAEVIFFDKTGTLTEGTLKVVAEWFLNPLNKQKILQLLRNRSTHPIALAVSNYAILEGTKSSEPALDTQFQLRHVPSRGLELSKAGVVCARLGSERWHKELGMKDPVPEFSKLWSGDGSSIVYFSDELGIVAEFVLQDTLKEGSQALLSDLRARGVEMLILSGDKSNSVEATALRLGIEGIGELMPEEKAKIVQARENSCFIGDGVNDALAMKAAGISIGVTGGMKATLEVADIFIASGEIEDLRELFSAASVMNSVVRRNLIFSVFYNLIGGALALSGIMNPLIAALLMPASSMTVVLHTLAFKPFRQEIR